MKVLRILASMVVLVVGLTTAGGASAHNAVTVTTPKDGAVLTKAPGELTLRFSDETFLDSVSVVDAGGEVIPLAGELPKDLARHFTITLPPLPAGVYTVQWQVTGMDSHEVKGRFSFTVDAAAEE